MFRAGVEYQAVSFTILTCYECYVLKLSIVLLMACRVAVCSVMLDFSAGPSLQDILDTDSMLEYWNKETDTFYGRFLSLYISFP